jgi:hypothetical protein
MSYKIDVCFRKPVDFSNKCKDTIIDALPGRYKVGRESLNDMSNGNYHTFEFENERPAANFAKKLLARAGEVLDVRPDFEFSTEKKKK